MSLEWLCDRCRRWVTPGEACPGCLAVNPADARWMTEREIASARRKAMKRGRR